VTAALTAFAPPYRHPLDDISIWYPTRDLSAAVPIADMPAARRLEVALTLLATATMRAASYRIWAMWDRRPPVDVGDPLVWMAGTPLFAALTAGLPHKRKPLAELADRLPAGVDRGHLHVVGAAVLAARAVAA
jgi:hypothetical protein